MNFVESNIERAARNASEHGLKDLETQVGRLRLLYILGNVSLPLNNINITTVELVSHLIHGNVCQVIALGPGHTGEVFTHLQKELGIEPVWCTHRSGPPKLRAEIRQLASGQPKSFLLADTVAFAESLDRSLARGVDVVHLVGFSTLGDHVRQLASEAAVVLTLPDAMSLVYQNYATRPNVALPARCRARISAAIYRRAEKDLLPLVDAVHVVAETDATYLRESFGLENLFVIPPLVPHRVFENAEEPSSPDADRSDLLLLRPDADGARWFWGEVWPILTSGGRSLRLTVFGAEAGQSFLEPQHKGVRFVSSCPDFHQMVRQHKVVLMVDMNAEHGILNRSLHAMAAGSAVVGTPASFRGIDVVNGIHCFQESSASGFVQKIDLLLRNGDLRKEMGVAARMRMHEGYSCSNLVPRFLSMYQEVLVRRRKAQNSA